jgi:hypothetical protein
MLAIPLLGAVAGLLFLCLPLLTMFARQRRRREDTENVDGLDTRMPAWVTLAWLLGLLLATPLYTPYPRLMLPLVTATWLATGAVVARWQQGEINCSQSRCIDARVAMVAIIVVTLASVPLWSMRHGEAASFLPSVGWADRTSLQSGATQVLRAIDDHPAGGLEAPRGKVAAVIYIHAEPALFYHLAAEVAARQLPVLIQPAGSVDLLTSTTIDRSIPTYFIHGPHTAAIVNDLRGIEAARKAGRITGWDAISIHTSPLVQLDNHLRPGSPTDAEQLRIERLVR